MTSDSVLRVEAHPSDGRGYQLISEQRFACPREVVFPFFATVDNLQSITPPWLNFSIVTPLPLEMKAGALIEYRLRIRCIPVRWKTEISDWEPPFRFVDQQLRGPYHYWHHEHIFVEDDHGTLVRDVVQYRPKGGRLVHSLFVKNDLLKIFRFRQQALREHFESHVQLPSDC